MGVHNRKWPWFAIRVRSATEKTVNLHLENAGYESFLPVAKCTRSWADGTEELEVPLFPGYLFCRMNPQHRLPILQVPGVIQIVGVGEMPIPAEEQEIAAIQRVAKSELASMPWPYVRGRVDMRIDEGPLKGLTGIVVKLRSGTKLVLSVSLLQQCVAVDIDRQWIGDAVRARHPVHGPQRGTPTSVSMEASRAEVEANAAIRAAEAR
jgi:transcription antitermination factor NusG